MSAMKKILVIALILCPSVFQICNAQNKDSFIKALFLLDIATHTQLPQLPEKEYVITVVGTSEVYRELLSHMAKRYVYGLPVKLLQVDDLDQLKPSQIIYLSANESDRIKNLLKKPYASCMIIGEQQGLYKAGAHFSFFYLENRKLKMDINEKMLKNSDIKFSKSLAEILHKDTTVLNASK